MALSATAFGFILAAGDAAANQCQPRRPLPIVILQSMGPCNFDLESLSFAGDPLQQAACLLWPVGRRAVLGPPLAALPRVLAERVGRSTRAAEPRRACPHHHRRGCRPVVHRRPVRPNLPGA